MRLKTAVSFSAWPVFFSTKIARGTPQARWRDSTQSGRPSTIEPMRLAPRGGYHLVSPMAFSANSRKVLPS